ncbi:hypothetical protein R6Q57_027045 [Mikania cordata]
MAITPYHAITFMCSSSPSSSLSPNRLQSVARTGLISYPTAFNPYKLDAISSSSDLTGGTLVPVDGPLSPLFALEINPEKAREEFRDVSKKNGGTGVKDFMDGMGLGMLADQLGELKLGELLDTPPPGLDEAIAISKIYFGLIMLGQSFGNMIAVNKKAIKKN